MRLWGYYAWHSLINSIKKIFRSQVAVVILGIVLIGGLFGGAAGIISSVMFSEPENEISTENGSAQWDDEIQSGSGAVEEFENGLEDMTEEDIRIIKMVVETGIMIALIIILLFGMYQGSKKGSDIFLMADVNFLFTAPLKPQSVLLFRLSFQMAAILFGSVYLVFQIPNLFMNLHLSAFAIFALFLAWIVLLLLQRLMSVFMYTLTATYTRLHKFVLPVITGIIFLIAALTAVVWFWNGKDLEATVSILYTSDISRMIPIIGWFKAMVMTGIEGRVGISLVYMGLLLGGMALISWGIWKIKADFYEDALSGAQTRDEVRNSAKEGAHVTEKKHSKRIKRNQGLKGWGANAFFAKEVYNRKRFAWFGVVTKTMLVYFLVTFLIALFLIRVLEFFDFTIIGVILAAILFFRNYGNPVAAESSLNWLFLVPENPYKKVFYAMSAGTYACALDMLPAMVVVAVLGRTPLLLLLLWFVVLVTMDFMLSAVGLLLEALFPAEALDLFKSLIQLVLKFVVLFLIVIVLVLGYLLSGIAMGLVFVLVLNIALGVLSFLLYPTMLHDGIA